MNNDDDNDLKEDITPKESINNLIIFNSNSDPELLEINYYGVYLKVKF